MSPRDPLTCSDSGRLTRCHLASVSNSCHFSSPGSAACDGIGGRAQRGEAVADRFPRRMKHIRSVYCLLNIYEPFNALNNLVGVVGSRCGLHRPGAVTRADRVVSERSPTGLSQEAPHFVRHAPVAGAASLFPFGANRCSVTRRAIEVPAPGPVESRERAGDYLKLRWRPSSARSQRLSPPPRRAYDFDRFVQSGPGQGLLVVPVSDGA
jgi:hypothetical protein